MSFAKSKTKRFNDAMSCAPPPGTYDPKLLVKIPGSYIEKDKRFKEPTTQGGKDFEDSSVCSISSYGSLETLTPRKSLFPGLNSQSAKKERVRNLSSQELAKQREHEMEMKRLVRERNDLEKKVISKEDDLSKLDNRLQQVQKDKTSLEAQIAALKKELASLDKSYDLLTQNTQDDIKKAVLDAKKPFIVELDKLKSEISAKETQLNNVSKKLCDSNSEVLMLKEENVTLKGAAESLVEQAVSDVKKEFETRHKTLEAEFEMKKSELVQTVTQLEEKLKAQEASCVVLERERNALKCEVNALKEKIVVMNVQKFEDDELIRHLKGEVFAMKDAAMEKTSELKQQALVIADYTLTTEKLSQHKVTLTEDIRNLTLKCSDLEKNIVAMEAEMKNKESAMCQELSKVQHSLFAKETECSILEQKNTELVSHISLEQEACKCLETQIDKLEQVSSDLSVDLQESQQTLSDTLHHYAELKKEMQSLNWDKAMLEGHVHEMTERIETMTADKAESENIQKDIMGQVVILKDAVDNKQQELNEAINLNNQFCRQLQQVQDDFAMESQKHRTREFLLQEQEKENYRELVRAQQAEANLKDKLSSVTQKNISLENDLVELRQEYRQLEENYQHQTQEMRDKLRRSSLSAADSRQQLFMMEQHLQEKTAQLEEKTAQLEKSAQLEEKTAQLEEKTAQLEERDAWIEELERLLAEEKAKKPEVVEVPAEDINEWQRKYETLYAKVKPFEEQLEAFESERCALLGISKNAQNEVEKLSRDYAKLLGHQNQKQKIHHILKIKEENNAAKLELGKLRELNLRQKKQISKLEEQLQALEGKKRFDATKAFNHSKENTAPPALPLRTGNRR